MKEKSWEFEGRTVEETLQTALEELGLERDDIHVEVLEEPQKGFLGLRGKEARIRVELIGEWEVLGEKSTVSKESTLAEEEQEVLDGQREVRPTESSGKPLRMIEDLLKIFEIDAMVEAREREDSVIIDVWGDDVAILIGRGGATLDSMQYLVNVCCRRTSEVSKRIIMDIEGYRKRRKVKVEKQAEEVAAEAITQRKSVELPPMSATERKTVHMALRKINGVWTESTGEGSERRVVIHPESQN